MGVGELCWGMIEMMDYDGCVVCDLPALRLPCRFASAKG